MLEQERQASGDEERPTTQKVTVDDLDAFLRVLPAGVRAGLESSPDLPELLEVILDLGRPPLARFRTRETRLADEEVTEGDIAAVTAHIGPFGDDNRAGIERTLHRISCFRNRTGRIVGLTCRVGRAVYGTIAIIEDLVVADRSVLLLGRPGVGKTTMLREVARVLADDARRRVVVVDTSNEIAGDGDIPHPAIGRARRMQVRSPSLQHAVMIEAVENHTPEVIIIDEMGTELEAAAARTIAERGVQLIGTAHGNTLDNLIMNPTLSDLVGGIQTVTLGDEEARRRGTQKSVLERKAPPTFNIVVEIQGWDRVAVHPQSASQVDALLRGYSVTPEIRWLDREGKIHREEGEPIILSEGPGLAEGMAQPMAPRGRWGRTRPGGYRRSSEEPPTAERAPDFRVTRVFPYGVGRERLMNSIRYFGMGTLVASSVDEADIILTTRLHYRKRPEPIRAAEDKGVSIYVLRKSTPVQIEQFLKSLSVSWEEPSGRDPTDALQEAEEAVQHIMGGEPSVELSPQSAYVRRMQNLLAERYNLSSASTGRAPRRRVIIYRT